MPPRRVQGLSAKLFVSVDHSAQLLAISYILHTLSSVSKPTVPVFDKLEFTLVCLE